MSVNALRTTFEEIKTRIGAEAKRILTGDLAPKAARIGKLLYDCVLALKAADDVKSAMTQAEMMVGRTPEWIKTTKAELFADAKKEIEAKLAAIKSDSAKLKSELAALARPKLPGGISDVILSDHKADVKAILDAEGTPGRVSIKAEEMTRQSVIDQDKLSVYVLAGGPLSMYYQLAADLPVELEARLSGIAADGAAGTALSWFHGPSGILAAITVADTLLFGDLQSLEESLG